MTSAAAGETRGGGPGLGAGADEASTPLNPAITQTMLTVFVIGDVLGAGIYAQWARSAARLAGRSGPRPCSRARVHAVELELRHSRHAI
jgi:hypothetical protein